MLRNNLSPLILLFALWFIATASAPPASAQEGDKPALPSLKPAIHFTHLTSDEGLVQNSVEAILQDRQGFMWIGTPAGLSRYDGYHFTTYRHDPDNPNSLSHNWVRDLFEDREGMIWIATEGGGVNKFDPGTETFTHYLPNPENPNSLGGDRVFSIFQDSTGNFWFGGTSLTGLNKFNPTTQTFTRFRRDPDNLNNPDTFQGSGVWEILEDETGQLWVTGNEVLARYNLSTERFTHYEFSAFEERRLAVLHRDTAGNLWVGGEQGLYKFNAQSDTFTHYPALRQVNDLLEDETGLFWVAALSGLYVFDPLTGQVVHHYRHDPIQIDSLNNDRITTLYQDRAGVLWAGTGEAGLNLYNPHQARFAHYRHDPNTPASLAQGTVNAIYIAGEKRLWVGAGSVLNQVDLATGQVTQYTPELPEGASTTIYAVLQDRAGFVWLGMSNSRLSRFDPKAGQFMEYPLASQALPAPGPPKSVVALYEDNEGALWVGVDHEGLYRLDAPREKVQFYETPRNAGSLRSDVSLSNIPRPPITNLYGDRAGNIWVSTWNGFSRFDPRTGTFHPYRAKAGHAGPDSRVEAILEDRNGLIWLASPDGLIRFDPNTEAVKYYTEKDGLPTTFVVGLLEDGAGNLWLSTKKGLSRFDPHTETFRNYDKADGLQGNEFSARAFGQAADGQIFFGGMNGLTTFYPEQISDNPYRPPVVLTNFQLFNKSVQPGENSPLSHPIWNSNNVTLRHDQNIISFEFAVLNYAAPHKNRYRYKLEGLEDTWNEVDSRRRFATYTRLAPGDYVFRVQGANNDGVWSDKEVVLNLTVLPPWWETTWFRAAALIGLVGLIYGGFRWRVYVVEHRNRQLEMEVAARTKDLREREEQLRQAKAWAEERSQAAEAANQAKSAFLANMSHELRSPLNAILGFAQIIKRNQELPRETQENLGIILRSGEHLLTLINQVLDLSKIEAGRITLNESNFDLHRLLNDLQAMFALKADEKQLQLIFDYADDLSRYIRTDEVKLRQVLINLLSNALKFTQKGGVTLRAGVRGQGIGDREQPSASLTPICFEVEDTGPGIPPGEMDQLFEAFAQTETGRQAQEGTGLGLPISRRFIQLMGGDITVKSQVGRGTIFTFNIQAQKVAHLENRKSGKGASSEIENRIIALEPGQPRYRILVVDDQWTNRRLLIKLLNPLGFDLREAENGQQALEVWQEFEPHLIWMDMRMPVMDGFEATRRIKATTKGQAAAIIALTASSFEEERAIVLSAGCDDFVRKPFREADIFKMMSKHIGVRYVYEAAMAEPEARVRPAVSLEDLKIEISALPAQLRQQLKDGTELGDMEIIDAVITEIRRPHPVLAEGLARLAHTFEYDEMLNLIQGADNEPDQETIHFSGR